MDSLKVQPTCFCPWLSFQVEDCYGDAKHSIFVHIETHLLAINNCPKGLSLSLPLSLSLSLSLTREHKLFLILYFLSFYLIFLFEQKLSTTAESCGIDQQMRMVRERWGWFNWTNLQIQLITFYKSCDIDGNVNLTRCITLFKLIVHSVNKTIYKLQFFTSYKCSNLQAVTQLRDQLVDNWYFVNR